MTLLLMTDSQTANFTKASFFLSKIDSVKNARNRTCMLIFSISIFSHFHAYAQNSLFIGENVKWSDKCWEPVKFSSCQVIKFSCLCSKFAVYR